MTDFFRFKPLAVGLVCLVGMVTEAAGREWPVDARYAVQGDQNRLNYCKCILLPRTPDSSGACTLRDNADYSLTGQSGNRAAGAGSGIGGIMNARAFLERR